MVFSSCRKVDNQKYVCELFVSVCTIKLHCKLIKLGFCSATIFCKKMHAQYKYLLRNNILSKKNMLKTSKKLGLPRSQITDNSGKKLNSRPTNNVH